MTETWTAASTQYDGPEGGDSGDAPPVTPEPNAPVNYEVEVKVPVTWTCTPEYDGWTAGSYTFTAALATDAYSFTEPFPSVTVTVKGQTGAVAQIGEITYDTLDAAVEAAADGDTIELLANCYTQAGFGLSGKTLTVEGEGYSIAFLDKTIYLAQNGEAPSVLNFNNCVIDMTRSVGTPTVSGESYPWAAIVLNWNCQLNFTGVNLTMNGATGSGATACYMHNGAGMTLTNSSMYAENYAGNGFSTDDGNYNVRVTLDNSSMVLDRNRTGFNSNYVITAQNGSDLQVINSRAHGSNGADYYIDNSRVLYDGNGSHGMSARHVRLTTGAHVTCNENRYYGMRVGGDFLVDSTSKLYVTNNSYGGDFAGLKLTSAVTDGRVEAGAEVEITGNKCSGLSNNGVCIFDEGSKLTIMNNVNNQGSTSYGGGIYNTGDSASLELPSDAVIYNNHAATAGDDIYSTGTITFGPVGSGWALDGEPDCADAIDGWYDDSEGARWEAHSKPLHAVEFDRFESSGMVAWQGALALKAAHGLIPLDPGDPELPKWAISKSKTATPLDEDLKSQVTLSLPSAEETLESDIVFVVDKSTSSRDESTEGGLAMLEALNSSLESTKAVINVGIVVFDGTYHVMRELSPYDAADVAEKMSAEIPLEEDTSGTNIEAGLLAAQAMLEEHTSVANNRKYVILVSDGLTRLFTGPDGETVQIIFNQLEADGTRYFGEYTTWCLSNGLGDGEYKVPGGVDWLTYYTTVIKPQVEADGDTYVMDFDGASIMTDTVPEKYIPLDKVQDHAQAIDRAFYDAYQAYLDLSTAYHCYAIYTGSSELGSSFMSTLSNGETLDFGDIQNDILYAVDEGSYVVDYIGYVAGSYDFDFVNDVSAMSLKVGEATYPAVRLADNRYGFKPVGDGTYAFTLEYERGNGLNEEHFTWTIGEAVSNFAPVQLTYTVKLVTPPTEPGDYKLDTNQIATLHPVNSDGTPGDPEDFEKPKVDYTVGGGTGPEGPGTDPTPPGGTDPTPPGGDGGTDIPDGNTPTTDLPDQETPTTELPEEETPTTELPDEETPLAEVPETGDMSALWLAMTALSGTGLAGVTFLGRKKRDEE